MTMKYSDMRVDDLESGKTYILLQVKGDVVTFTHPIDVKDINTHGMDYYSYRYNKSMHVSLGSADTQFDDEERWILEEDEFLEYADNEAYFLAKLSGDFTEVTEQFCKHNSLFVEDKYER